MKRTKVRGMLTVEAAILVPIMMLLIFALVFLVIFHYDKAMVVQDVNAVIADIRAGNDEVNLSNHPYLLMKNLKMEVKRGYSSLTVKVSGEWNNPVWQNIKRVIEYEETVSLTDPIDVMRITEDLIQKAEKLNDSIKKNP
ncbi:MAG: pilus assembly protein [Lachnospiraceae bacterium]|nr:pilus assembly protein [Lachnospiraceae bacterium]